MEQINKAQTENSLDIEEKTVSLPNTDVPTDDETAEETIKEAAEAAEATEATEATEDADDAAEESVEHEEEQSEEDKAEEELDVVDENCTTDENDIAYVAERITGVRHSRVSTAAPVRVRENKETVQMNSLRRIIDDHAEKASAPIPENEMKKRNLKLYGGVAAVVALMAAIVFTIVKVNTIMPPIAEADHTIGAETGEDAVLLEISHKSDDKTPDDTNDLSESDSESETETEPVMPKYTVTLDFYDLEDITVATDQITLGELLESCNITLADGYIPELPLDSVLAADVTVKIDKYEYKTEIISDIIPYSSNVTKTDLIPRGEKRYTQYGENGQVDKIYTVEYINGVETNRTYSDEVISKYPVDEAYEEGVGGSFVGLDGKTYTYSYRRVVPATYYNIEGLTYVGTMADESVIAVDMNYIPLGTKLYVKNDRYDFGVRIASDIGSLVNDWEIDIWIGDDNPYLPAFSIEGYVYDMEIYYID